MFSVSRPTRSPRFHPLLGLLLVGLLAGGVLAPVARVQAKEVDVVGTVDCGQRSGRRCEIRDVLTIWTDSLRGVRERVALDVSWVRSTLPALDQDDEIAAVVDLRPDGTLQVLSLDGDAHHDGTVNVGASTGSKEVTEARHDRGAAQDRDRVDNTGGTAQTGILTGAVRNASTGAAVAGATVSVGGQSAVADASGRFTLGALAAGTVTVDVSASGFVAQQQAVTIVAGQTVDLVVRLVAVPAPGRSSIVGTVVDAATGAPIEGAMVAGGGLTVVTGSAGGFVLSDLAPGTITVTVSATGYTTRQQSVTVASGAATSITVSLAQATGTLNGTVRNAGTGVAIAGATVRASTGPVVTTDGAGRFTLAGLRTGPVTLDVSASGFVSQQQTVTIAEGANDVLVALPEVQPDIAVTVTWGPQPFDLDAHLSGPGSGGTRFHVSFVNKNPVPYAGLTMDTQAGFGPEQVVIRRDPNSGQFVPGEYRFWVNNFSESPEFDVSQARAVITQGGGQLGVFTAATATGDPDLDVWYVVRLTIDAAGNVTQAPVQQFVSGDETTILSVPAGTRK
jgi:hypothetical protein